MSHLLRSESAHIPLLPPAPVPTVERSAEMVGLGNWYALRPDDVPGDDRLIVLGENPERAIDRFANELSAEGPIRLPSTIDLMCKDKIPDISAYQRIIALGEFACHVEQLDTGNAAYYDGLFRRLGYAVIMAPSLYASKAGPMPPRGELVYYSKNHSNLLK